MAGEVGGYLPISNRRHRVSCICRIRHSDFRICAHRRAIGSKHSKAIVAGKTPSASTINGAPASFGSKEAPDMSKLSTTTTDRNLQPNPHPGEILLEAFLKPIGFNQNALARAA